MASQTWRTINLGKLRSVLPDGWSSEQKTRFVREIRESANIVTALHNVGMVLVRMSGELALDQFLQQHGFLVVAPNSPQLQNMPAINLEFELRPSHLVPVAPINQQDGVFTFITPQNAPATVILAESHGKYPKKALACILGRGQGSEPGFLRNVYEELVHPNLLEDRSRLKDFIELARQPQRLKKFEEVINQHLGSQMRGNMCTLLVSGLEAAVLRVLKDCVRELPAHVPQAVSAALVERTLAFLSPRHVRLADIQANGQSLLPLDQHHPMFDHLPDDVVLGQASRQTWLSAIRPIHRLMRYALLSTLPCVLRLPPQAVGINLATVTAIRQDAGPYQQWRQLLRDGRICDRILPLMRYLSRLHRSLSVGGNGQLPADFKSIHVFPSKTAFRTEMITFNSAIMEQLVMRCLVRPWDGMHRFESEDLFVSHDLGEPPSRFLSRTNSTEYASRQVFNVLFPGMFRVQAGGLGGQLQPKRSPLISAHRVRLRGEDRLIGKCFIRTDGLSISFSYQLKDCEDWVAQPRIAGREEVTFVGLHKNTPVPDTAYPGTQATGSLSFLSRQPILPLPHFLGPPRLVIGIDPGQASHVVATIQDPADAYDALIAAGGDAQAKQVFRSRQRKVRGRHSKERTLAARSNRIEAHRRSRDASDVEAKIAAGADANELRSVDTHMENLRQFNIITGGANVEESAEYLTRQRESFTRLNQFWNSKQHSTKQRFINRATQASYQARLARFVSWKIHPDEFLKEGRSIVVRHPRQTARKWQQRRKTRVEFERPPAASEPIVAFGWGQGGGWSRGHASASQFTLAREMAIQGATVLLTPERGTSSVCTARLRQVPALGAGALPLHHNVAPLQIRYRGHCTEDDHTTKKTRAAGHRHTLQRLCTAEDGTIEVTSDHTDLGNWTQLHRLQICRTHTCDAPNAPNVVAFDARLRQEPPHLNQHAHRRVLNRDSNSAAAMRHILLHYIFRAGERPAWNGGHGFHGAIPAARWAGYVAPDPDDPATFAR